MEEMKTKGWITSCVLSFCHTVWVTHVPMLTKKQKKIKIKEKRVIKIAPANALFTDSD